MNHFIKVTLLVSTLFVSWCYATVTDKESDYIHFAVSAEYPPFEYNDHGVIKGFDIDLARLIAKQLGKKAFFDVMQFSSILPALSSKQSDAAISTITITEQRKKSFDFSQPYYFESLSVVFDEKKPITKVSQLSGKKIAVQLGSTMEIWLKKNAPDAHLLVMDNNNQTIAALKAGHVDLVMLDGAQGVVFSQKNPGLSSFIIAKSADGYGLAFPKDSPLTQKVNKVLDILKQNGELAKLQNKWLEGTQWMN